MDVMTHWADVCAVVEKALKTKGFCTVATVSPDGSPHLTPIGSLFLHEPGKACYFEKFPARMRRNLEEDQRICILAVQGGFWSGLWSLFRGRYGIAPGVRLYGRVGARRPATSEETRRWLERVKVFRGFKGYDLLWKDMSEVRDIAFDAFEPLHIGPMTRGLWGEPGA